MVASGLFVYGRAWHSIAGRLILAMLGEQFTVVEQICGAVITVQVQEDIISVWNKTAADQATTAQIQDTLQRA